MSEATGRAWPVELVAAPMRFGRKALYLSAEQKYTGTSLSDSGRMSCAADECGEHHLRYRCRMSIASLVNTSFTSSRSFSSASRRARRMKMFIVASMSEYRNTLDTADDTSSSTLRQRTSRTPAEFVYSMANCRYALPPSGSSSPSCSSLIATALLLSSPAISTSPGTRWKKLPSYARALMPLLVRIFMMASKPMGRRTSRSRSCTRRSSADASPECGSTALPSGAIVPLARDAAAAGSE
mmetsp:Transcript_7409/g.26474  ORF Transcript_7409/g.26474 Transcript_7409/m.26474 type:complete len:240 (-) Transcript_7409:1262-1981(-)